MAKLLAREEISLEETLEQQESEIETRVIQSNGVVRIDNHLSFESFEEHPCHGKEEMEKKNLDVVREFTGRIVNSGFVSTFIICLIIINSIMMGIGTFDFVSKNEELNEIFEKVDLVFLIIFSIEAGMSIFHLGLNSYKNKWLVFDTSIVVFSWALSGGVTVVRALRVFRALRLMSRFSGLRNLISGIGMALPRLMSISSLLVLIIYIFGVLFCEMFRPDWENGEIGNLYFSSLKNSLITSVQMMVFDDWAAITRETMTFQTYAWIPIVVFVIGSGLILTNMFIAVLVVIMEISSDEFKREMLEKHTDEKFTNIVASINDKHDHDSLSSQNDSSHSKGSCDSKLSDFHDLTDYSINLLEQQLVHLVKSSNDTLEKIKVFNKNIEQERAKKKKRKLKKFSFMSN